MFIENNNQIVNTTNNQHPLQVPTLQIVVKKALKELAISLCFTAITAAFIVTPFSLPILFALPLIMVIFNTTVRCIPIMIQRRINTLKAQGADEQRVHKWERHLERSLKFVKVICPLNFAIVDINTRGLVLHEAGHAVAATALYKNANPSIALYPGKTGNPLWLYTGETNWSNKEMTGLGKSLGSKGANLVTVGAGAAFSIINCIVLFTLSYKLRKTNPELSRYFLASAIATTVQHIFYALSALWERSNSYNDFSAMWAGGIHPFVSILFLALPLIVRAGLSVKEAFQRNRLENRQLQPAI